MLYSMLMLKKSITTGSYSSDIFHTEQAARKNKVKGGKKIATC